MKLSPVRLIVAAAVLLTAQIAHAAPLPQRHPYQVALRNYFATLKEEDFAIELKPLTYDEEFFKNPANVQRYWLLGLTTQPDLPSVGGALVAPKHFLLTAMEAGDAVNIMGGPKGELINPAHVSWWVQWDYPGNPYHNNKALKLRAFVNAAADMMMQDEQHESGGGARSDFLGGAMIRYAYTYYISRDVAPEAAQKAFAAGLIRMFEKLESWKPSGGGGSDMEFFQLVSMYYAGQALGGDFPARALKRAHVVIDTITSKTGYEKHGAAFDISYQGIALRFLTWAVTLYKDPKVDLALHKMLVLKAYNSLPEPDGSLHGPTIFNTGTAADAPHDQWAWESRDYAMAMIDDTALYNIWARTGVADDAAMRAAIKATFTSRTVTDKPSEAEPGPWKENHWGMTLPFAFDQYKPGSYERWTKLAAEKSPLTKPVWSRGENFINDLNGGGEFLAAKFNDYGVVIHTGAIANHWAGGVSGKSGGSVVAFWTPSAGNVLLGRTRATQGSTNDEWDDKNNRGPYTWAVHAITGKGGKGNYFSTARLKNIKSNYVINGNKSAVVTVSGDLAGEYLADTFDELKGKALYAREFKIDNLGVGVTSSLSTDGSDKITELYEMIPVFLSPKEADPKIELRVNNNWVAATDTPTVADQVRVIRYGVASYVIFEKPRPVKLGPLNNPEERWHTIGRNVLIDVSDLLPNVEFKYRLMGQ